MSKTTAGAGLLALAAPVVMSCTSSSSASSPEPVILRVSFGPTTGKQMGRTVLGYERYIGKTLSRGITVSRVENPTGRNESAADFGVTGKKDIRRWVA